MKQELNIKATTEATQRRWLRQQKVIFIIAVLFSLTGMAQQGFIAGLGPSYELDQELYGVNARIFYGPNHSFCFGPEFSFFPYQEIDSEYEELIIDLNINAHYIWELSHKLGVYPLSGINYTIEKERNILFQEEKEKLEAIGLNYGIGAHYNLGRLFLFLEFKGIIGELSDEFITTGVIFSLSKSTKKKHKAE